MRSRVVRAVLMPLTAALLAAEASPQQVTIEDTGSTNRPGVKLIVTSTGAAQVEIRDAEARKTNIDTRLCDRLFQDLKSAGSLGGLPRTHCMKSVSFGSSLYMEFNGERSPDLSCPAAQDSKVAILQKDARDVMEAAHATPKMTPRTFIYTVPRK